MDEDIYEYGFSSGWLASSSYEARLESVRADALQPVSQAFRRNMMRVRTMGMLPIEIAFWTRAWTRVGDMARISIGEPLEFPGRVRGAPDPSDEFKATFVRLYSEWERPPAGESWEDGGDLVKRIFNKAPDHHGMGAAAMLSSLLLTVWTAVEAALIDALVTAVNEYPDPLASSLLASEKTIPLTYLREHGYDLSNTMGSILQSKLDTSSISAIRKRYEEAFDNSELKEIFDEHQAHLSELEAIRNLFAHRGGLVDRKFLRRVNKSAKFKHVQEGHELVVGGKVVSFYSFHAAECATKVLVFVDRWIHDRPQKVG